MCRKIRVYKALFEERNGGFVWLRSGQLNARSVVRITNQCNGRSLYCDALIVDNNMISRYNTASGKRRKISSNEDDDVIVIGYWYRDKLGLDENAIRDLNFRACLRIERIDCWLYNICACLHHPDLNVRIATILGLVGVALGIMGVAIPIIPKCT